MYHAFLALYLITSDTSIFGGVNPRWLNDFVNEYGGHVHVTSYCVDKPCVLKCCGFGEVVNSSGDCDDASQHPGYLAKMDYSSLHVFSGGGDSASALAETNINIDRYLLFDVNTTFSAERDIPDEFYILENGSILMWLTDPTQSWVSAPPLSYCVDFALNYSTPEQKHLPLAFKLIDDDFEQISAMTQLKFVVAGLVCSFLVLVLMLVRRSSVRTRRTLRPVVLALAVSLLLGYATKIVQLYAFSTGAMPLGDCTIFSPIYYFWVLSNFVWANILVFDLWWRIRCYRLEKRDFHHSAGGRFVWYCACGWGAPLLATATALAADLLHTHYLLPVLPPPFDNCFTNEAQTLWYVHAPAALLAVAHCALFSMLVYHIAMLKRDVTNSKHYETIGSPKIITTKHKFLICMKLLLGAGVVCTLWHARVLGLPLLPTATVLAISIYFWLLLLISFLADITALHKLAQRFKANNGLSDKFQASQFLKEVAKNVNLSRVFVEGLKQGDTQIIIKRDDDDA